MSVEQPSTWTLRQTLGQASEPDLAASLDGKMNRRAAAGRAEDAHPVQMEGTGSIYTQDYLNRPDYDLS
jgi:hypothetical protein